MWACTCMCVYVPLACMTTPLPSMRQHLREAAMEMCARPQHTSTHTHTHTLRQTNTVRSLRWAPRLDFAFSLQLLLHSLPLSLSCSLPSFSLSSDPKCCKCHADRGGFFLSTLNPPSSLVGVLITPSLSSLISTNQVNFLRGTALRLSQS